MQDLRFSFRALKREWGFTAVAVLILALGIGANITVFSVVNRILLRPLPFRDSERLVRIVEKNPKSGANTRRKMAPGLHGEERMPVAELKQEPMMEHLIGTLESGNSIGHYGRLVFVMVARHFLEADELTSYLKKDPECDEEQARALISQVEARNYNPPKRERILEWMRKQDFPVCPEPEDPGQCNVYRNLNFPQDVYNRINEFYQHGSSS